MRKCHLNRWSSCILHASAGSAHLVLNHTRLKLIGSREVSEQVNTGKSPSYLSQGGGSWRLSIHLERTVCLLTLVLCHGGLQITNWPLQKHVLPWALSWETPTQISQLPPPGTARSFFAWAVFGKNVHCHKPAQRRNCSTLDIRKCPKATEVKAGNSDETKRNCAIIKITNVFLYKPRWTTYLGLCCVLNFGWLTQSCHNCQLLQH